MSEIKLILFDLDGVLIDSKENMRISWRAVQTAFEIDVPFPLYFAGIGRPFFDILERIGVHKDYEKVKRVYDTVSSCRTDLIMIHKESAQLLRELRSLGLRIGVVTSKDKDRTEEILGKMDINFDVVDCPQPGSLGKPHPDPLNRAMASLNFEAKNTLYVGDMDVDYQCSQAAGAHHIHVDWGYGNCPDASFHVNTAEEILFLLEEKFGVKKTELR